MRKVFISFRYSDGIDYKDELINKLGSDNVCINKSEDEDRSGHTEGTIWSYLKDKLSDSSVTIILLTAEAIDYKTNEDGEIDDWLYDEVRYSLEDRENNRTNGIVAVYTNDVEGLLKKSEIHKCQNCDKESTISVIMDHNNLFHKNMLNVCTTKKKSNCVDVFDSLEDTYCSLISYEKFIEDPEHYIENSFSKKGRKNDFNIVKRLN